MSFVDSKATFRGRALEMGIPQAVVDKMAAKNWDTYGNFAYSTSYQPGMSASEAPFIENVVKVLCDDDPEPHCLVPLRRLFAEAFLTAQSDLKQKPAALRGESEAESF